jgi:RHS repeat-associated protein
MSISGGVAIAGCLREASSVAHHNYGPFGEVIRATGPMAKLNPFRFSTKYQDDETDFLYYGYRYYNPSIGRWPNRDPKGETGGENLYGFVANAAPHYFDLLGLLGMGDLHFQERECSCKCRHLTITFKPGGDKFQAGWYKTPPPSNALKFGNYIGVFWSVEGDPRKCKYFQNEKGYIENFFNGDEQGITVGQDNQQHPDYNGNEASYGDGLGTYAPFVGSYEIKIKVDITFKCVDADGRDSMSETKHIAGTYTGTVDANGTTSPPVTQ